MNNKDDHSAAVPSRCNFVAIRRTVPPSSLLFLVYEQSNSQQQQSPALAGGAESSTKPTTSIAAGFPYREADDGRRGVRFVDSTSMAASARSLLLPRQQQEDRQEHRHQDLLLGHQTLLLSIIDEVLDILDDRPDDEV